MNSTITQNAERNFILQQGFLHPDERTIEKQFSALQFQPRVVGLILLTGIIIQQPLLFLVLGILLYSGGLFPGWNLFDVVYNATFGRKREAYRLTPAPAPRMYASKMSGVLAFAIGVFLLLNYLMPAYLLEAVFLIAGIATIFGKFCIPTFTYHALRGNRDFAKKTLPWSVGITP